MNNRNKVYEMVKKEVLNMLDNCEGKLRWIKPWCGGAPLAKGYYAPEDCYYNGVNLLLNRPSEYITMGAVKQLHKKDSSIKIRKGSHMNNVYFFKWNTITDEEGNIELDENGKEKKYPVFRFYKVFSIDQIENLESRIKYEMTEHTLDENMQKAQKYIETFCKLKEIDMEVKKGGSAAYYNSRNKSITLPDKTQYKSIYEYYGTVFHEISHELDDELKLTEVNDEKDEYSASELLAEISSSILLNLFMIPDDSTKENSLAYIQGWHDRIQNEEDNFMVSVCSKCWKATQYFMNTVEMELLKEKAQDIEELAVKLEGDTYVHIQINSDEDFDYSIYKQELEQAKLKLIDGGVIERGESVDNLFAALTDIIDGYNLNFKTLEEIDMEDFEAVLNGDISVKEMCR